MVYHQDIGIYIEKITPICRNDFFHGVPHTEVRNKGSQTLSKQDQGRLSQKITGYLPS